MSKPTSNHDCGCSSSACGPNATRRQFLELVGATAAVAWLGNRAGGRGAVRGEGF